MLENRNYYFQLVEQYGTPLYIYDSQVIHQHVALLREMVSPAFQIWYSVKANPSLAILKVLKPLVDGVEVASAGELARAVHAGFEPQHIIFVGPGKTPTELEYAVQQQIRSIVIESVDELQAIAAIASRYDRVVPITIRINPQYRSSTARIKMGGGASQFGIDEEYLPEVIKLQSRLPNVRLEGLHIYMGTQILDSETLIEHIRRVFLIARHFHSHYGISPHIIDVGGGFGIPYFPGESPLQPHLLKNRLFHLANALLDDLSPFKPTIAVESGRFLVADSGIFLTQVLYKKQSRGKIFVIVDGGSHQHSSAAGIGRFVKRTFPLVALCRQTSSETETVDIVGPLCTPTDLFAQGITLPSLKVGDVIAILKSGAYCLTASPVNFLSHPHPAEVLLDEEGHHLIQPRLTLEDLLPKQ